MLGVKDENASQDLTPLFGNSFEKSQSTGFNSIRGYTGKAAVMIPLMRLQMESKILQNNNNKKKLFSALLQHFPAKVISQGSLQGKWHLSKSAASLRTHKVLLFPVIDLKKA